MSHVSTSINEISEKPFRLLDLPGELRNDIYYQHALSCDLISPKAASLPREALGLPSSTNAKSINPTNLILANKQIFREATPVLHAHGRYVINVSDKGIIFESQHTLDDVCSLEASPFLQIVRHLRLDILWFGSSGTSEIGIIGQPFWLQRGVITVLDALKAAHNLRSLHVKMIFLEFEPKLYPHVLFTPMQIVARPLLHASKKIRLDFDLPTREAFYFKSKVETIPMSLERFNIEYAWDVLSADDDRKWQDFWQFIIRHRSSIRPVSDEKCWYKAYDLWFNVEVGHLRRERTTVRISECLALPPVIESINGN